MDQIKMNIFYAHTTKFLNNRCAKRHVVAVLIPQDSLYPKYYIDYNSCKTPQEICPRHENEDYTKCKTICNQKGHAEINVLNQALDDKRTKGSLIILMGHTYCCNNCLDEMKKAGVQNVIVM